MTAVGGGNQKGVREIQIKIEVRYDFIYITGWTCTSTKSQNTKVSKAGGKGTLMLPEDTQIGTEGLESDGAGSPESSIHFTSVCISWTNSACEQPGTMNEAAYLFTKPRTTS